MSDLLVRAFRAALELEPTTSSGGRKLTGRLVPYNVVTEVADPVAQGGFDLYHEAFSAGAFNTQVNTNEKGVLNRISLVHRHEGGRGLGYLGPFTALRDEPDGLWGDVAILRSKAEDVKDLLDAGISDLSVEFRLTGADHTKVDDKGVRWRVRAHLDGVALEPKGAYPSAEVMAFRSALEEQAKMETRREEQVALEQAERKAEEEAKATRAEEFKRLEAEAAANIKRRQEWDLLAARLDREKAKQNDLVRTYGYYPLGTPR